jgi:hypothetical protein
MSGASRAFFFVSLWTTASRAGETRARRCDGLKADEAAAIEADPIDGQGDGLAKTTHGAACVMPGTRANSAPLMAAL